MRGEVERGETLQRVGFAGEGGWGGESPRFRAAVHRLPLFESVG